MTSSVGLDTRSSMREENFGKKSGVGGGWWSINCEIGDER